MPVTNIRAGTTQQVGGATTVSGAQDAASIGAAVLLALKGQPPGTMAVRKELLEQLANAVVQLANDVVKLQGAGAVAASPEGPRVAAHLQIHPNSIKDSKEFLDRLASKIRVQCSELGIKLDVKVGVASYQWQLDVSGEASKAALDSLRKFIASETTVYTTALAKVDVLKYDLL